MEMEWHKRVIGWSAARRIFSGSSPSQQFGKLLEEVDELKAGIDAGDAEEVMDAIGDCSVVLCNIAAMYGLEWPECMEAAWDQIKDRRGEMRDGVFVKEADL
jgi:NTP pyrophosphatase (non-canonical NTP hydrolase)